MALPRPVFAAPPEPFAEPFNERDCDQSEKPGVVAFREFVFTRQGGVRGRILGPCGPLSGHASGRAWDWMIRADEPSQRARADELIDWLLANDAEMFRRAGLRYIIWDRRVWSTLTRDWRPYDGYDIDGNCSVFDEDGKPACRNPHTDHVHFSFGIDGAAGRTSFFGWLGTVPAPLSQRPWWPAPLGFAVGLLGVLGAKQRLP